MIRKFAFAGLTLAVTGCGDVGPVYTPPTISLAPEFVTGGSVSLLSGTTNPWWERLNDPLLNQLVARGAQENLDVKAAYERIIAANAVLGQTGLNLQTNGALSGDASRQRVDGSTSNVRGAQVDASYVIDLFGGFARGQEQALANYEAAQFDVGTVRLAYLADLTNSYLQARYYQEAAAVTRQTIASRRQTLGLVQERLNLGQATELELQQARSLLAAAQAPLPVLVANFELHVFHIATLLAEPAGPLLAQMQKGARQPRPTGFTTVGLPADLIRNRPDVRFAERNLAAATAAVGVAEAALYPSVTLNGTIGTGTTDRWSFGPAVSIPALNRGLLRNRKLEAMSAAREAELGWRQTVLVGVEEVQVAMTLCLNWLRQLQFQERAVVSSEQVLRLSRETYEAGNITLTEVLDAERQNAANKLAVAEAVRSYTVSWMQVQVATGQGWGVAAHTSPSEVDPPAPTDDPLGASDLLAVANRSR